MEQKDQIKIGIIICDRYHRCAGGKCFRALRELAGAFGLYRDRDTIPDITLQGKICSSRYTVPLHEACELLPVDAVLNESHQSS